MLDVTSAVSFGSGASSWLRFDLQAPQEVVGVVTQGQHGTENRVTHYKVRTGLSDDRDAGTLVNDGALFTGNADADTKRFNYFNTPVSARYVWIEIDGASGHYNGQPSLRAGLTVRFPDPPAPPPVPALPPPPVVVETHLPRVAVDCIDPSGCLGDANGAINNVIEPDWVMGAAQIQNMAWDNPWISVDMGAEYAVGSVEIYNRADCCATRLARHKVIVGNHLATRCTRRTRCQHAIVGYGPFKEACSGTGRYVYIYRDAKLGNYESALSLREFYIFSPGTAVRDYLPRLSVSVTDGTGLGSIDNIINVEIETVYVLSAGAGASVPNQWVMIDMGAEYTVAACRSTFAPTAARTASSHSIRIGNMPRPRWTRATRCASTSFGQGYYEDVRRDRAVRLLQQQRLRIQRSQLAGASRGLSHEHGRGRAAPCDRAAAALAAAAAATPSRGGSVGRPSFGFHHDPRRQARTPANAALRLEAPRLYQLQRTRAVGRAATRLYRCTWA